MSVIAVVDVGSNSIKVAVVATTDRKELGRKSEPVRLQPEGGPAEPFSSEARAEAVAAIGRLLVLVEKTCQQIQKESQVHKVPIGAA